MCPRTFRDPFTVQKIPDPPGVVPIFYCQKGFGYFHQFTKTVLCEICFENLPRGTKTIRLKIRKHCAMVNGYFTGLICDFCKVKLSTVRYGHRCPECLNKYRAFLDENPGVVHRVEGTLIEILIGKEVTVIE